MEVDGTVIKEISKLLKTPYILITFALASGLILFLPDDIINKMYIYAFLRIIKATQIFEL